MSENDFKRVESNSGFGYVYAPEPEPEPEFELTLAPLPEHEPASWVSERLVEAATATVADKVRIRELEQELKVMAEDRDEYQSRLRQHIAIGSDYVENPSHYTTGDVECIDAIRSALSDVEFEGYCQGNAIKYLWRYKRKGKPSEDLKKARWYIERLLAGME